MLRSLEPEIMDDHALDEERHFGALRGLERINRWSGSLRIVWPAIFRLCRAHPGRTLSIVDLATGGGDIPLGIYRRAARLGLNVRILGCDSNPRTVAFARKRAAEAGASETLQFAVLDALRDPLPNDGDVLLSSLFLHHLSEGDAERLMRRMGESARQLVLINDLLRSRRGLLLAHAATRLLTSSPVVHADGPQSVRAAFTLQEVHALAQRAGLESITLERRWPCRFLLQAKRTLSP
jgi:SAM-dependent methyltransferase